MKKLSIVALLLCAAASESQAESISDALKDCGRQQNSLKRLVCYDKVVQNLDRYSGLDELMNVPAPLPAQAGSQAPSRTPYKPQPRVESAQPSTPSSDFGMENRRDAEAVDKIYGNITELKKGPRKRYILTLDNGQVWKQTDNETLSLKVGQTVYVERGVLGAFYMSKDSVNRKIRVKRSK